MGPARAGRARALATAATAWRPRDHSMASATSALVIAAALVAALALVAASAAAALVTARAGSW